MLHFCSLPSGVITTTVFSFMILMIQLCTKQLGSKAFVLWLVLWLKLEI